MVSDEGSCGTGESAEGLRGKRSSKCLYTSCAAVGCGTNRQTEGTGARDEDCPSQPNAHRRTYPDRNRRIGFEA